MWVRPSQCEPRILIGFALLRAFIWCRYVGAAQPERTSNPNVMGIAQRPTLGRATLVTRPYGRNAGGSEPVLWIAAEDAEFNATSLYAPATFQVLTNATGQLQLLLLQHKPEHWPSF